MSDHINRTSAPHLSLFYCLDRPYLDHTLAGPVFVYYRIAIDIFLTVAMIVTNITLIMAIFKYRRRFSATGKVYNSGTSMKFVQVLAVSDVLVGLSLPVYLIPHYVCDINDIMRVNMWMCMSKFTLTTFSAVMSNFSLLCIAVDRFLAVNWSMEYSNHNIHRFCNYIIIGQTVVAAGISSIPYFINNWTPNSYCDLEDVVPFRYILSVGVPIHSIIIMMVSFVHITMHNTAARRASQRSIVMEGQPPVHQPLHTKSVKVVAWVTGAYFFCWTPYSICLMVRVAQSQPSALSDFFFQALFPLSYANSLINPFIYAWKNAEIKIACKWYLRRASNSTCCRSGSR